MTYFDIVGIEMLEAVSDAAKGGVLCDLKRIWRESVSVHLGGSLLAKWSTWTYLGTGDVNSLEMREVIHNHIQACPVELGSTDYECGDALEPGHRHHDGVLVGILKCV